MQRQRSATDGSVGATRPFPPVVYISNRRRSALGASVAPPTVSVPVHTLYYTVPVVYFYDFAIVKRSQCVSTLRE